MLGHYSSKPKRKEEAEKPFWISFADLMSALMILFLLVMSVALLSITDTLANKDKNEGERAQSMNQTMSDLEGLAEHYPGMKVNLYKNTIHFGEQARFSSNSSDLSPDQAQALRAFVPQVLKIIDHDVSKKWLKRVVVEGFSDHRGDYLLNLNLSLQRSQRVLCILLAGDSTLSAMEKKRVQELFIVGGYSSNAEKSSLDESRRIEFRLEFYTPEELNKPILSPSSPSGEQAIGSCRI